MTPSFYKTNYDKDSWPGYISAVERKNEKSMGSVVEIDAWTMTESPNQD